MLYPTGWAARFRRDQGLVRSADHVVMDMLAHPCLQEGAAPPPTTSILFRHLDIEYCRNILTKISAKDKENGILVVTEGLFSMDSDTPRSRSAPVSLPRVRRHPGCRRRARPGRLGDDGRGHIGLQKMLGKVDIVMGSFSKTFASNGGFVACKSRAVKEYLRFYQRACDLLERAVAGAGGNCSESFRDRRFCRRTGAAFGIDGERPESSASTARSRSRLLRRPVCHRLCQDGTEGLARIVSNACPNSG